MEFLVERNNLFHYVNESREQFLREVVKEEVVSEGMLKVEIRKRRKENLMNKNLHSTVSSLLKRTSGTLEDGIG